MLTQLGKQITKEVCAVYNRSPFSFVVAPFVRLGLANACAIVASPIPNPSEIPLGGQCYAKYRLRGEYTFTSSSYADFDCEDTAYWQTNQTPTAKIVGYEFLDQQMIVKLTLESQNGAQFTTNLSLYYATDPDVGGTSTIIQYNTVCGNRSNPSGYNPVLKKFVRTDGLPDDCHIQEPSITEEDRRGTITINNFTENNTEIEGDEIEYFIENDFENNEFKFPITVSLDSNNTISLDLDGININRNNNEYSVNFNRRGGGGGYPGNLPPPNDDNSEPETTGGEEEETPENDKKIYKKREVPEGEETQDTGIDKLDYIQIDVTSVPSNAPSQEGKPGDDIYFPGFAEFKSGGYNYPRIPLHFKKNLLRAPDGADGYAVRIYDGYKGKVTVFYRKN